MSSFSGKLKELRKCKGATQKEVADYLCITDRAYQNYEYGNSEAPYSSLIKLADFFDVSTDYLLGRTDNPIRVI